MAFSTTRARMSVARYLFLLPLLITVACGASTGKRPPEGSLEPDKFLFDNGSKALTDKRWYAAREYFRQLVDNYPQSVYRADAKLGIADTYSGEKTAESSVLAVNEYREFLALYPTSKRSYEAQFKLGMVYHADMRAPERDQTETREAVTELTTFVQRCAAAAECRASPLAEDGQKRLREAKDRLSMSEYRVGFFYYRQAWYPGAIERFMGILKSDPDFTNRDGVYYHLAQIFLKAGRPAEALPYLDKLVKEFEKSEFLEPAQKLIDQIKTGTIKEGKTL
jgi:outer membrane protein assembly factor BamD